MASTLFIPGTVVRSVWLNEVDKATHNTLTAVAGTNTVTATGPVTSVSYVTGDRFFFVPANANSGAVTVNINGLGAKSLTKYGTVPLVANDLIAAEMFEIVYDGVQFQLQNPRNADVSVITGTLPITNGGTGATTGAQALINLGATGRLINTQLITSSGNFTPTAGTTSILCYIIGAGGGGGGSAAAGAGVKAGGSGGAGGALCIHRATSGFSGSPIVIGGAGTGGVGGANGVAGGATTFLGVSATGGSGGAPGGPTGSTEIVPAGVVALGTGGNVFNGATYPAAPAFLMTTTGASGSGGPSFFGGGGQGVTTGNGTIALTKGAGGAGAFSPASSGPFTGGAGANGAIVIFEYS